MVAMTSCERKAKWRASEKGYASSRRLDWTRLGIDKNFTYTMYLEMIVKQHSKCAVTSCSSPIDTSSPLDHNHKTGKVRAVLCQQCNLTIGLIESERRGTAYLQGALSYLSMHNA